MNRALDKIELFLLCFTAFMIPIHIKLTSVSIALLMLVALLKKENYKRFISLLKNYKYYLLCSPLILSILGLYHTEYFPEAKSQIEIVVSLAIFPFIFTSFKSNKIKFSREYVFSFFVVSSLFAYFICMAYALPAFAESYDTNVFLYSAFSMLIRGPHHLSYCIFFSFVLVAFSFTNKFDLFIRRDKSIRIFKIVLLILFLIFIFQLSSKITILLLVLFSISLLIYMFVAKQIGIKKILLVFLSFIVLSGSMLFLPKIRARFDVMLNSVKEFDKDSRNRPIESTELRFSAIEAALSIIRDNFWIGVGTGDLSTEMSNYYKENNSQGAYINHISPHNQMLRTFAMYGVIGFSLLVGIFIMLFYSGLKDKNFLLITWTLFMLALFNVEDMLMIQDGIIMFSFFSSYFLFYRKRNTVVIRNEGYGKE